DNTSANATFTGALAPRLGTDAASTEGFIGYSSRSGVLAPYTNTTTNSTDLHRTVTGCGVVGLNGVNAWNGTCNPNNTVAAGAFTRNVIGPGGVSNPGDATATQICPGDLQVSLGQYTAWGYIHVVTNSLFGNPDIPAFLTFLRNTQNAYPGS